MITREQTITVKPLKRDKPLDSNLNKGKYASRDSTPQHAHHKYSFVPQIQVDTHHRGVLELIF